MLACFLPLDMVEGVDFELRDISQLRKQGGTSISKIYMLTPDSFKICLMRARRYTNQTVDPTVYGLYFILLEKMFLLFNTYELAKEKTNAAMIAAQAKLDAAKAAAKAAEDAKTIAEMLHKQELRDEENKREREAAKLREEEFKRRDEEQQRKINQLLGYAIETKATVDVAVGKLDETNTKLDEVHRMFYNHVDISFKDYFMEIVDQEGEFVVHHSKLIEYGIVTSERSSNIKQKLDALGMVEGVDFTLLDVQQRNNGRGSNIVKSYMLTPGSFKKCLMRAQRANGWYYNIKLVM